MEESEENEVSVSSTSTFKAVEDESSKVKGSRRIRKYDDAFATGGESDDEKCHIVPEATFPAPESLDLLQGIASEVARNEKEGAVKKNLACQVPSCQQTFGSDGDYQRHYSSRHMHTCASCKKPLPSNHILELHVLEVHDTLFSLMAEKKPMYQCFLETCLDKFSSPSDRKEHCLAVHKFPEKFQYWNCAPPKCSKSSSKSKSKNNKQKNQQSKSKASTSSAAAGELLPDLVPESQKLHQESNMEIDDKTASSTAKGCSKTVPKHIAFGHAPHRAFKVKHTFALGPDKTNGGKKAEEENKSLLDMKDVGQALENN